MVRKALYLSLFVILAILLLTGCPPSLKKPVISNFDVLEMVNENASFNVSAAVADAETVKFTFNSTVKNGVESAGVYSATFTAPEVTADSTYSVKVEASSAGGDAAPQTKYILVKNVPNAPVIESFTAPENVVTGALIMLSATITDPDNDLLTVKFVVDSVEHVVTPNGDVYEYSFNAPDAPTSLEVSVEAEDETGLTAESSAETIVVDLAGGAPPVIEKLDIVGSDFIVLPCGLSSNFYVVFEAIASDPEGNLQEFVAEITNPEGEVVETIDLLAPPDEFASAEGGLYTIFYEDLMNSADNIVGGKYTISVIASDEDSQAGPNMLYFWVHSEQAMFTTNYEFLEGVVLYDGHYIFTQDILSLQLSMWLDSRVTVRVYAIDAYNEWDCNGEPMFLLVEKDYQVDELMLVTDTVSVDVSDLDHNKKWELIIVAFNPECGEIPCAICAINSLIDIEPFIFDIAPAITCWAYGTPCYPCCGGYRLFANISSLLFKEESFFDVFVNVNGTDIPGIEILDNGDGTFEARVEIFDGMVEPVLDGPTPFTWTVITATGKEASSACETIMDFMPPDIMIDIDTCISEVDMGDYWEVDFTVAATDNFGLEAGNISLDTNGMPAWLHVNWPAVLYEDFDLEGLADGFTGYIEFNPAYEYEGPMMLTVEASDIYCIQGIEHKEFIVDTYEPRIDFGLLCPDYCDFQCNDTYTYLHWIVEDAYFDHVEISVSGNTNLGEYDGTLSEGQVRWNFPNLDCEVIYITLTAYDLCGNCDSVTLEYYVDNVAPVIEVLDIIEPGDPCNDISTWLQWCVVDNCFDHVRFTISDGYIVKESNVWQVDYFTYESDISSHTAEWIFEEVNCAPLIVDFWVYDECGNVTYEQHVTDNIINNTAPTGNIQIFDKFHYEEPECNATCVAIFWEVDPEIDCLEYAYIETNYPAVPCGNIMSETEGVYTYDINWTYGSGWIDFCLPIIDCDTFVATLVIGDNCLREVEFEDYVQIDNSAPLVSVDWRYGEPACYETYAEIMVTFIDGANEYPCVEEPCLSHGYWNLGSFTPQTVGDKTKWTAYGTWYFEEVECEVLEAYLTMGDHCCLINDYRKVSEPSCDCCNFVTAELIGTHYTDNIAPEVYSFYTAGPDIEFEGFEGCGVLGTELYWEVQDGCEIEQVVIEFSHRNGPLTQTFTFLEWDTYYSDWMYWDFGPVDGEIVWARITVYDECGNSDSWYIESYEPVDNLCPQVETFGFDSATEKLIIWYHEDIIIPEETYANIYVWLGCGDCGDETPCEFGFDYPDWALLAVIPAFDASGTYIHEYLETPGNNDLVVDIHAFRPDYNISPDTFYGFEIFGIHDECENSCVGVGCCTARDFTPMF